MIRGMHHISLATADMDRFVAFYRDLLGVQLDRVSSIPGGFEPFENIVGMRETRGQVAQFQLGNMQMEVFCYAQRSEERRLGKEGVSTGSCRGAPSHKKKKKKKNHN